MAHSPRFVAALACRNRSVRLYAKPLQLLGKQTILEHLVERLRRVKRLDQIILAISNGEENLIFVEYAKRLGLDYVFGDEKDMQGRLILAGDKTKAEVLLRVTTECPFPYVENIEDLLEQHLEKKADLTVCEGLPEGAYSEIISLASLKKAHAEGEDRHRSEYSTLYLCEHPEKFRLLRVQAPSHLRRPEIRLTVDYPEDLIVCRAVAEALGQGGRYFTLEEIIAYMDAHPALKAMNGWIDSGQGRIWA
jgi:spore coat polysaccharide biosynthesis protein SpsF